jgi:hypothetical protein
MMRSATPCLLPVLMVVLVVGADGRSGAPALPRPDRARSEPVSTVAQAAPKLRITSVLGVRVGMNEAEAHLRLGVLGQKRELESEGSESPGGDSVERELWTLRGTPYRYVVVGIEDRRVVAVQAFARPDVRSVRYADVGELTHAKRLGFYIYDWRLPARDGAPNLRIEARGTDPEYLSSYSIARDRTVAP